MYSTMRSQMGLGLVGVRRDSDGLLIPPDPDNVDWQAYEAWIEAGNEPTDAPGALKPIPEVISDRQFAQALALDGTIDEGEALAWAARGDLPEAMEAALVMIPERDGQQFGARMMLAAATTYERHHPLTAQLGALLINTTTGKPYDAAALDALWARAAAL